MLTRATKETLYKILFDGPADIAIGRFNRLCQEMNLQPAADFGPAIRALHVRRTAEANRLNRIKAARIGRA